MCSPIFLPIFWGRCTSVFGEGHPADGGASGQGGRKAGSAQGGRGVLHAHVHCGLHRGEHGWETGGRDENAQDRLRILKVLDPACGSGSFLLGAYQFLLDWHLDWYTQNDPEKWAKGKEPALAPTVLRPPPRARGRTGGGLASDHHREESAFC